MASQPAELGRRERQIVETVYRLGRATVAQVLAELPDPPSYSAVRECSISSKRRDTCDTSRTDCATSTFPSSRPRMQADRRWLMSSAPSSAVPRPKPPPCSSICPITNSRVKNWNTCPSLIRQAMKEGR